MASFDVVSKLEHHEIDNAVDQARREVSTRFDFKDTGTEIEKNQEGITLRANSEGRLEGALKVLEDKFVKRKISLQALDPQKAQPAGGQSWKQLVKLKEGVDIDTARAIVKAIKDSKIKVQAAIQGDLARVTGKKRDEPQQVIALLRAGSWDRPLQYINFRD